MMKVNSAKKAFDEKTFEPVIEINLTMGIELFHPFHVISQNEQYQMIGEELVRNVKELLKEK